MLLDKNSKLKARAVVARKIEKLRSSLGRLYNQVSPGYIEGRYQDFRAKCPRFSEILGDEFCRSAINGKKDYYIEHAFLKHLRSEHLFSLHVIERALEKEQRTKKRFFHDEQFDRLKEQKTTEGFETLLNEMIVAAPLYMHGLDVQFRDSAQAGSDLIWVNKQEQREVHIEIVTFQYTQQERARLNKEIPEKRKERAKALREGAGVVSSYHVHNPFAVRSIAAQVERIRTQKRGKNQVAAGNAGVQLVVWDFGFFPGFFEAYHTDRWYCKSGIIYHAYYGKKGAPLFNQDCVMDMVRLQDISSFAQEPTISDGRFSRPGSKFASAIFVDPSRTARSVYLRNYSSEKPLTRFETLHLIEVFDAGDPPSRWTDQQEPPKIPNYKIFGQ